jgi:hypothetical protein
MRVLREVFIVGMMLTLATPVLAAGKGGGGGGQNATGPAPTSSQTGGSGKVKFQEFTIKKLQDQASPALRTAPKSGGKATNSKGYLRYNMRNVN